MIETKVDLITGGPIRAPAPDPPVNINDLLSNLISTGLISTTASTSTAAPAGVQSDAAATAPRPFNALVRYCCSELDADSKNKVGLHHLPPPPPDGPAG